MMTTGSAFSKLGISQTKDIKAIKKAYADKCRVCHPEDNPEKWQELQEAYSTAKGYAQAGVKSGSESVLYTSDFIRKPIDIKSHRAYKNGSEIDTTDNELNDLFEELDNDMETKASENVLAQLEKHLESYQQKIKSIIYPYSSVNSTTYWGYEKKLIQYHKTTVKHLSEDLYGGFSDNIISKAVSSIAYTPNPWKPSTRYKRKAIKVIKSLRSTLEEHGVYGYSEMLSGLIGDYIVIKRKSRKKYIKSLAINAMIILWLGIVTFAGTSKVEVPDYVMHYEEYAEDLPEGTPISVNISSAAISAYYEKHSSIKNPVGSGSYRTVTGQTVLRAQSEDGQIIYIVFEKEDISGLGSAVSDTAVDIAKRSYEGSLTETDTVNIIGTIEHNALSGYVPSTLFLLGNQSIYDYMYDPGAAEEARAAINKAINGVEVPKIPISLDELHNYETSPTDYYIRYNTGLPKEGEVIYKTVTKRGFHYERLSYFIIAVLCMVWQLLSASKWLGVVKIED